MRTEKFYCKFLTVVFSTVLIVFLQGKAYGKDSLSSEQKSSSVLHRANKAEVLRDIYNVLDVYDNLDEFSTGEMQNKKFSRRTANGRQEYFLNGESMENMEIDQLEDLLHTIDRATNNENFRQQKQEHELREALQEMMDARRLSEIEKNRVRR